MYIFETLLNHTVLLAMISLKEGQNNVSFWKGNASIETCISNGIIFKYI